MSIESGAISPGVVPGPSTRRLEAWVCLLQRLVRGLRLLYFRPSRFVAEYAVTASPLLVRFLSWTYGMALIQDFESVHQMNGKEPLFCDTWLHCWTFTVVGGLLVGWIAYQFGGWWFELRLWASGVNPIDRPLARAVYLSTAQILVLPTLLWTVGETLFYSAPPTQSDTPTVWALGLLLFPFWAIRASHIGVNTVFGGSRPFTLIWFLILPTLLRLFGVLVGIAAMSHA